MDAVVRVYFIIYEGSSLTIQHSLYMKSFNQLPHKDKEQEELRTPKSQILSRYNKPNVKVNTTHLSMCCPFEFLKL